MSNFEEDTIIFFTILFHKLEAPEICPEICEVDHIHHREMVDTDGN